MSVARHAKFDVRWLVSATTAMCGSHLAVIKLLSLNFDPMWRSGIPMLCACLPAGSAAAPSSNFCVRVKRHNAARRDACQPANARPDHLA
ncbi:hypothetical protein [Noviherbaspirillum sp. Root189]|uniref:hypothetical protein n=1 Tax=Noviherbaspirillum sp. Root189 TaxID=1736487 RepID=UPI0012E351CA|nr:hypothetical protein [Noviherbaspirillum sp. Root189]